MRSLGIVIYPDGSQAEIWDERWVSGFAEFADKVAFRPLKKPRRLTYAPYLLLVLLSFALSGCVHLQRVGDKPICLLDYETGIKYCGYDTWQACHADLRDKSMCYHR